MAWSAAFAPAADQRHYRYNTTGLAQVTPLTAPSRRIPLIPALSRTYIRITGDRVLPPALQDRMIAEADVPAPTNPFDVHSLNTSHLTPITRAADIADILIALSRLTTTGLGVSAAVPRAGTGLQIHNCGVNACRAGRGDRMWPGRTMRQMITPGE